MYSINLEWTAPGDDYNEGDGSYSSRIGPEPLCFLTTKTSNGIYIGLKLLMKLCMNGVVCLLGFAIICFTKKVSNELQLATAFEVK